VIKNLFSSESKTHAMFIPVASHSRHFTLEVGFEHMLFEQFDARVIPRQLSLAIPFVAVGTQQFPLFSLLSDGRYITV
jgi:hypothetical protein